jgi:hypothetical protein
MKDLFTKEEFEPKRSNQKFANAKNRQDYHNTKANKLRKAKAFMDKPVSQNFKILDELMEGKATLEESQDFLRGKGYNRKIYHRTVRINGQTGYLIYNYILIYTDSNVTIIRNN